MIPLEKFGLVIIIMFYSNKFPDFWRGGEIVFFIIGCFLFISGKSIEEWLKAYFKVDDE